MCVFSALTKMVVLALSAVDKESPAGKEGLVWWHVYVQTLFTHWVKIVIQSACTYYVVYIQTRVDLLKILFGLRENHMIYQAISLLL